METNVKKIQIRRSRFDYESKSEYYSSLKKSQIRIRIFGIQRKRFESESESEYSLQHCLSLGGKDISAEEISSNTGLTMGPATTCPGTLVLVLLVGGHIEREEHQHKNVCICIVENTWKCTHSCAGAIADGTLFRDLLNLFWAPLFITPTVILKIHL